MIELQGVCKAYRTAGGVKRVLKDVSLQLPFGRSIGVLGRNGAGKSTLLRLLAGTEMPDRGRIVRQVRLSWPLGMSGALHGSLSGIENTRFVCRIYGLDFNRALHFVSDFSELGDALKAPLKTYSSGMRARLGFALSMAADFDCYLVDEITAVGDEPFQKKCRNAFAERRARSSVIMVSHQFNTIRNHCDMAAVLAGGSLTLFDDLDAAAAVYRGRNA